MGERLELRLKSPVGAEPAVYPWPLPVYVSGGGAGPGVTRGEGEGAAFDLAPPPPPGALRRIGGKEPGVERGGILTVGGGLSGVGRLAAPGEGCGFFYLGGGCC